ncbi:hypothetical protein HII36_31320 [Nonomuraea sp. NN258]|uniref:hypothetical protein n=1 Tax=Nonomuraea antri TaxID=2730852 RepID=UPI0015691368|nr:hypothetical protein [Nonomuraea antri]NRQ36291.1 hypothetical protein [Nonomuraea antri]
MSDQPYTHVTLSLEPDKRPRVNVSFHTHKIHLYNLLIGDRPALDLTTSEASVSISTSGAGPVTEQDLTLAHQLFNAAARYLADCQRLHSAQSAPSATATDTAA